MGNQVSQRDFRPSPKVLSQYFGDSNRWCVITEIIWRRLTLRLQIHSKSLEPTRIDRLPMTYPMHLRIVNITATSIIRAAVDCQANETSCQYLSCGIP